MKNVINIRPKVIRCSQPGCVRFFYVPENFRIISDNIKMPCPKCSKRIAKEQQWKKKIVNSNS